MGRELKRKQAKKDGKNVREIQKQEKEKPLSSKTFINLLIILILFFIVLYIITGLFITKELKWFNNNKDEKETVEVTNKILAIDSLKQREENYYVFYYDASKEETEITNMLYNLSDKVYRVDLNDDFNSNFIGEPSNIVDDINNLKVEDPTLIKVSSEEIVEFYSGKDEIKSAINK